MRHPRKKHTKSGRPKGRPFHPESNLAAFLVTAPDDIENPDWLVGAY